MKGYKIFNPDWTCRGFQYEVGKTYTHDGVIDICDAGFHFCKKVADCFTYYSFDTRNKIAEVEAVGIVKSGEYKYVTDKLKIVRELSWHEILELANIGNGNSGYKNSGYRNSGHRNNGNCNSGDWNCGDQNSGDQNSGHRNSGDKNSGDKNSGDWNSGHRNSGDWNSGDWNSCDYESGCFNSKISATIRVFNKECDRAVWKNAIKPPFLAFSLTRWVDAEDMSDDEKTEHPDYQTTGGYLQTLAYKEAWRLAYESADSEDIELLKALPNFDAEVFETITGIRIG